MIQPIPDKTLNDLKDLVENNYSLIFSRKFMQTFERTLSIVQSQNESGGSTDAAFLKILITDNPKGQLYPFVEFVNKLVFEDRSAAFGPWPFLFLYLPKSNKGY